MYILRPKVTGKNRTFLYSCIIYYWFINFGQWNMFPPNLKVKKQNFYTEMCYKILCLVWKHISMKKCIVHVYCWGFGHPFKCHAREASLTCLPRWRPCFRVSRAADPPKVHVGRYSCLTVWGSKMSWQREESRSLSWRTRGGRYPKDSPRPSGSSSHRHWWTTRRQLPWPPPPAGRSSGAQWRKAQPSRTWDRCPQSAGNASWQWPCCRRLDCGVVLLSPARETVPGLGQVPWPPARPPNLPSCLSCSKDPPWVCPPPGSCRGQLGSPPARSARQSRAAAGRWRNLVPLSPHRGQPHRSLPGGNRTWGAGARGGPGGQRPDSAPRSYPSQGLRAQTRSPACLCRNP